MKKERVKIAKKKDRYYVIDTELKISYPLDPDKCLIKQINDICEIMIMKEEKNVTRNKN